MLHLEAGQLDDAEHRLDEALASEDMPVPLTRVLHCILRAEVETCPCGTWA